MKSKSLAIFASLIAVVSFARGAETPMGEIKAEKPRESFPSVKFGALLQAWGVNDDSTTTKAQLNFRLRRAEAKISGAIVENTRYFLMVDPAKTINATGDNKIIQDLGVGFMLVPGLEILGGQFKTLTTAEGLQSSAELPFPERSIVGRTFGDKREPGLMVSYDVKYLKVGAMVSNGQGTNADATKDTKDLSLRVDASPASAMKIGGFLALGDFVYDDRARWGANARFSPPRSTVGVEYAMGRDKGVNSLGLAVEAGYSVTEELEPVARFETIKPDVRSDLVGEQASLGVNYYLSKHKAKMQASASYLHNLSGNNGSPRPQAGSHGGLITMNLQVAL